MSSTIASVAGPSLPSGVPATPQAAIAQGDALFASANAFANKSQQGLPSLMGAAASIVSQLPPGTFTTAFADAISTASEFCSAIAAGTAVGGPYGAVAGACVAAISTVMGLLEGGPPQLQGDLRSRAEQSVFPARSHTPSLADVGSSVLDQQALYPVCWPDVRLHTAAFLPDAPDADDPSGGEESMPGAFSFGVGWLPAPGSTSGSTAQAYALAQSWLANTLSPKFFNLTDAQKLYASGAADDASTAFSGNVIQQTRARNLLASWYGTRFYQVFLLAQGGGFFAPDINPSSTGAFWTPGGNVSWQTWASEWAFVVTGSGGTAGLNQRAILDYTYYFPTSILLLENTQSFGSSFGADGTWQANVVTSDLLLNMQFDGTNQNAFSTTQIVNPAACPDTTIFGLAEIASLVATGGPGASYPATSDEEADLVALHYVLGLQWLWIAGQKKDLTDPYSSLYQLVNQGKCSGLVAPHPNFSRIIGIIQAKIAARPKTPAQQAAADRAALGSRATSADFGPAAHAHASATAKFGGTLAKALTAHKAPPKYTVTANGPVIVSPGASGSGVRKAAFGAAAVAALVWWFL